MPPPLHPTHPANGCSARRRAFTIIELVVSTAVLSIIALLLLFIINEITRTWQSEMGRMDAYSNGRALLELMSMDLNQAMTGTYSNNANNSIAWGNVPDGTEFNWRPLYLCVFSNPVSALPSSSASALQPIFSACLPITRSGDNTRRAVTYALSNAFLLRIQTADQPTVWSEVTNQNWYLTPSTPNATSEILAENVYWVRVDVPGALDTSLSSKPQSATLTMRVAQNDLIKKVRSNPAISSRLPTGSAPSSSTNMITNAGVREISTVISLNDSP